MEELSDLVRSVAIEIEYRPGQNPAFAALELMNAAQPQNNEAKKALSDADSEERKEPLNEELKETAQLGLVG